MRRPRRRTPRAPRRRAECVLPRRLLEQYHGLRETGERAWRYAVARTATPQEGVGGLRPVTEDAGRRIKNRRARGARSAGTTLRHAASYGRPGNSKLLIGKVEKTLSGFVILFAGQPVGRSMMTWLRRP